MKKILCLGLSALCLQSCVPVVVGGAAAATAAVVVINDHRSSPTKKSDKQIQKAVSDRINDLPQFSGSHIVVTVFASNVLLTGQTPNAQLKSQATELAKSIPNITRIYNQIEIASPNSELSRMSDYWITTKINTLLMQDKTLNTAQIEILTQNGTVYVMGTANQDQASHLIRKIQGISGVEKVVKMLNYQSATVID